LNDLANNCRHTNGNIRWPNDPRVKHMLKQYILKNTKTHFTASLTSSNKKAGCVPNTSLSAERQHGNLYQSTHTLPFDNNQLQNTTIHSKYFRINVFFQNNLFLIDYTEIFNWSKQKCLKTVYTSKTFGLRNRELSDTF
jgi:hypothetical protein